MCYYVSLEVKIFQFMLNFVYHIDKIHAQCLVIASFVYKRYILYIYVRCTTMSTTLASFSKLEFNPNSLTLKKPI